MSHHIVDTKDLYFNYPDGSIGLSGISFHIAHGESVAIVGENGAGKSTLLLHLNGFLKPHLGTIQIGDEFVVDKNLKTIRKSVGMVFQNSDDQLFMPTVYDDVAFGPMNLGVGGKELEETVNDALAAVGSIHLKTRNSHQLSQGEKKSVAIASVLSMKPDVLVMDEPSSSLDPKSRRGLIDQLQSFKHTKIIATHDLDLAYELCERTIVLHDGAVKADGPTRDIFQNEELLFSSGLEKPLRMQSCLVCGGMPRLQAGGKSK